MGLGIGVMPITPGISHVRQLRSTTVEQTPNQLNPFGGHNFLGFSINDIILLTMLDALMFKLEHIFKSPMRLNVMLMLLVPETH